MGADVVEVLHLRPQIGIYEVIAISLVSTTLRSALS
jgi:hypothetical protein